MNAPEKPQAPQPDENLDQQAPGLIKTDKRSQSTRLSQSTLQWHTEAASADPWIKAPEVETARGEPLNIDLNRLRKQGFIVPGGPRSRTVQEFRGVKRSLLLNAIDEPDSTDVSARCIMITSALPGEGKSFCAANLALSLVEERDYSVLLVDGDVAQPSLPTTLNLPETPGILDALANPDIDVRSLIRPTSIPKLTYLSAGKPNMQATELVASSAMADLVNKLVAMDSRQIVVFDSPPLLVSTEAPSLPRLMGQIVLVVETGSTRRSAVINALTVIDRDDDSVTILLNKASGRRAASGYGGYGYGYGYGANNK